MRRYRNVPPLQFLQGFEAAARLGSFSKAAEELGLSQSAVSHEMRLLEERVDQKKCFERAITFLNYYF